MASPLDSIRETVPWMKDLNDDELLQKASEITGMGVQDVAEYFGVTTGRDRSALSAGLRSGWEGLKGIGYSTMGAGADVVGATNFRDWSNKQAALKSTAAQLESRPDLENIEDVWKDPSKYGPYAAYQLGLQGPQLAASIGAGALVPQVAVPAWLARAGAVGPKVLGMGGARAGMTFAEREAALKAGQTFGKQVVGGGAFNYGQGVGSLYQEAVEGGDPTASGKSFLGGVPYALTETVPEAMLAGRLMHGSGLKGNLLKRMGISAAVQGTAGATSEALQNEMEMAMRSDLSPEQVTSRRINAPVAGGLVEGILGGAGGIRSNRKPLDKNQPADLTKRLPDQDYADQMEQTFGSLGLRTPEQQAALAAQQSAVMQKQAEADLMAGYYQPAAPPVGAAPVDQYAAQMEQMYGLAPGSFAPAPAAAKPKAAVKPKAAADAARDAKATAIAAAAAVNVDPVAKQIAATRAEILDAHARLFPQTHAAWADRPYLIHQEVVRMTGNPRTVDEAVATLKAKIVDAIMRPGKGREARRANAEKMIQLHDELLGLPEDQRKSLDEWEADLQRESQLAAAKVGGEGKVPGPVVKVDPATLTPTAAAGTAAATPATPTEEERVAKRDQLYKDIKGSLTEKEWEALRLTRGKEENLAGGAEKTAEELAAEQAAELSQDGGFGVAEEGEAPEEKAALTVRELAGKLGIAKSTVQDFLAKTHNKIETLATKHGITADDVYELLGLQSSYDVAVVDFASTGYSGTERVATTDDTPEQTGEAYDTQGQERETAALEKGESDKGAEEGEVEGGEEVVGDLAKKKVEFESKWVDAQGQPISHADVRDAAEEYESFEHGYAAGDPKWDQLSPKLQLQWVRGYLTAYTKYPKEKQAEERRTFTDIVRTAMAEEQEQGDETTADREAEEGADVTGREEGVGREVGGVPAADAKADTGRVSPAGTEGEAPVVKRKRKVAGGKAAVVSTPEAEEGPSAGDIHKLADEKNIPWDDDPAFMAWSKEITGKERIDDMTGPERQKLYAALQQREAPAASKKRLVLGKKMREIPLNEAEREAPAAVSTPEPEPEPTPEGTIPVAPVAKDEASIAANQKWQEALRQYPDGTVVRADNGSVYRIRHDEVNGLRVEKQAADRAWERHYYEGQDNKGQLKVLSGGKIIGNVYDHTPGYDFTKAAPTAEEPPKPKRTRKKAEPKPKAEPAVSDAATRTLRLNRARRQWLDAFSQEPAVGRWDDLSTESQEEFIAANDDEQALADVISIKLGDPSAGNLAKVLEGKKQDQEAIKTGEKAPTLSPEERAEKKWSELHGVAAAIGPWSDLTTGGQQEFTALPTKQQNVGGAVKVKEKDNRWKEIAPRNMKESTGEELPDVESKMSMDEDRMGAYVETQMYGELKELGPVSIKEMAQNAFDAIKDAIHLGRATSGKISITLDEKARTITVTDNGVGMTADIINNAFLKLAGSHKESKDPSGSFGLAKGIFLYGNKSLKLTTVRDGIRSTLETTGAELKAGKKDPSKRAPIKQQRTSDPSGTTVVIELPDKYHSSKSDKDEKIDFPEKWDAQKILNDSPLFADIEVEVDGMTIPVGKHFPKDEWTLMNVIDFPAWGKVRVLVTPTKYPPIDNVAVLSKGIIQFKLGIAKNPNRPWDAVPYKFFLNIEPSVDATHHRYPFALNRQGISLTAKNDFDSLIKYLNVLYANTAAEAESQSFGELTQYSDDGKTKTDIDLNVPKAPVGTTLAITKDDKVEIRDGRMYVNNRVMPELTKEEMEKIKTDPTQFRVDQSKLDPDKLIIHDNVVVVKDRYDDSDKGEPYLDKARAELGDEDVDNYLLGFARVFRNLRNVIAKVGGAEYADLTDVPVGVSVDITYHGVNTSIPFRAMMVNPTTERKGNTSEDMATRVVSTMIHEFAHHKERNHSETGFIPELQRLVLVASHKAPSEINKAIADVTALYTNYRHVYDWFVAGDKNGHLKARGIRLADSAQVAQSRRLLQGAAGPGGGRRDAGDGTNVRQGTGTRDQDRAEGQGREGSSAADGRVSLKTLLDSGDYVFHAVRNDEDIAGIFKSGLRYGSNLSYDRDGQAFEGEGDTILVFRKSDVAPRNKGYQNDGTVTKVGAKPVAIIKDTSVDVRDEVTDEGLDDEANRIVDAIEANEKLADGLWRGAGLDVEGQDNANDLSMAFYRVSLRRGEERTAAINGLRKRLGDFYDRAKEVYEKGERLGRQLDDLNSKIERGATPAVTAKAVLDRYKQHGVPVHALPAPKDEGFRASRRPAEATPLTEEELTEQERGYYDFQMRVNGYPLKPYEQEFLDLMSGKREWTPEQRERFKDGAAGIRGSDYRYWGNNKAYKPVLLQNMANARQRKAAIGAVESKQKRDEEQARLGDARTQAANNGLKLVNTTGADYAKLLGITPEAFWKAAETGNRAVLRGMYDRAIALMNKRDAYNADAKTGMRFSLPRTATTGMSKAAVDDVLAPIIAKWENAPPTHVVQSIDQLSAAHRSEVERLSGEGSRIGGFYFKGEVWLIADNIKDAVEAQRVILHEVTGHYGLRGILGGRVVKTMDWIYHTNPVIRNAADAYMAEYPGTTREIATEETLAHMAESGKLREVKGWRLLVTQIKSALRKLGFNPNFSNDDILALMAASRKYVEKGKAQRSLQLDPMRFSRPRAATAGTMPAVKKEATKHLTNVESFAQRHGLGMMITSDIVDLAARNGFDEVRTYVDAAKTREGERVRFEQPVGKIVDMYDSLPQAERGIGPNSVNKFIHDATMKGNLTGINRFSATGQELIKAVFKHGKDTLQLKKDLIEAEIGKEYDKRIAEEADDAKKDEMRKEKALALKRYSKLMTVPNSDTYAPLKRFGDYVVSGKSAEYLANEKADTEDSKKWLRANEGDPSHYQVHFVETQGEANALAETLRPNFVGGKLYAAARDADIHGHRDLFRAFPVLLTRLRDEFPMPGGKVSPMERMIRDLYLQALAENHARKIELRRRGISGASHDMMRAFVTQGHADASFLSNLKHNDAVQNAVQGMRNGADRDPTKLQPYLNEMLQRHAAGYEVQSADWASKIKRTTSIWMLATNPTYYLQQLVQVGSMSQPIIAATYGYWRTLRAIKKAYTDLWGLIKGTNLTDTIDWSKAPADVRDMLNTLAFNGAIDVTNSMDQGEWETAGKSAAGATWNRIDRKLRGLNTRVEAMNRSVTATAAYRLHLSQNGNVAEATKYAEDMVRQTHGSYDGANTPRYMQGSVKGLLTQFRRFQIIQLSLIARLFHNSFSKGVSAGEKAIARRALTYTLLHAGAIGGTLGMPGAAVITGLIARLFGPDDEPPDFEKWAREAIDNQLVADLLLKGVPAMLGADASSKFGWGNMLSINAFADFPHDRASLEKYTFGVLGPGVGLGAKAVDGLALIYNGDVARGAEQLLPSGFSNAMKGYRYGTEGITMRKGDVLLSPDEIDLMDSLMQGIGLPTTTITRQQRLSKTKFEFDTYYKDRTEELIRDYRQARRDGDPTGDVIAEWNQLQEARVRNGYARQPLSTLLKSVQAQRKRERETAGGVEFTKANKRFVQQQANL